VKRFENRSGVSEFRSFNNGTSKGVLDLLETVYLVDINILFVTTLLCLLLFLFLFIHLLLSRLRPHYALLFMSVRPSPLH